MYDAIILAGGENGKQLEPQSSSRYEALTDIAGRPMVTFVAEALAATDAVREIIVLGPADALNECSFPPNTRIVQSGPTMTDTIRLGMAALGHTKQVLVVTGDIPLLTPAAVEDFIYQCTKVEADLYYVIVPKEANERHFPGTKRTYVRLREGVFTGGNIFLVNPLIVDQCMDVAEVVIANRKNPLKLCQMLGWSFVFRFLLGVLHLKDVRRRVCELLGVTGAVIESAYPELGIDVDKPSDLELVRASFGRTRVPYSCITNQSDLPPLVR